VRKTFILLAFAFFAIGFIFFNSSKNSYADSSCSSLPTQGFNDASGTCNPQDKSLYPSCNDLTGSKTPYVDCRNLNGCYFTNANASSNYCAYKIGASPIPTYNCQNRDPKCPAATFDCQEVVPGSPQSLYACVSPNCAMTDYTTGKHYCAFPKGGPLPTPVGIQEGQTGCSGRGGTQGTCVSGLTCNYDSGTYANFIDGINTIGRCNFIPDIGCSPACPDNTKCSHTTINSTYTCVPICPGGTGYSQTAPGIYGCITVNSQGVAPICSKLNSNGTCAQVVTGLGPIGTDPQSLVQTLFGLILSISGGIALLLIIISGYRVLASQGNPEALKGAREQLTAAIVGLLFIIFALVILQIIGYDILHIPGFGSGPVATSPPAHIRAL